MTERPLDRRELLCGLPVATWLVLTHGTGLLAEAPVTEAPIIERPGRHSGPRIRRLELVTSAPLGEMKRFYGELLGLEILDAEDDRLTIAGGSTPITFTPAAGPGARPFYHFAFNIPENKILAARDWQLQRTALVPPDPHLLDPEMPEDVVWFRSWDAHSIFFWDPGGNLVEYIARHTLANAAPGPFSNPDILYASEIGLVTDDTAALARTLTRAFGLETYGSGSAAFRALGDEEGLLLAMIRGRKMGFSRGRPIAPAPVGLEIRGPEGELEVAGGPFRILSG